MDIVLSHESNIVSSLGNLELYSHTGSFGLYPDFPTLGGWLDKVSVMSGPSDVDICILTDGSAACRALEKQWLHKSWNA